MNLYEQVIHRWKSQGLLRNPAVSANALDQFEEENGLRLPRALRRILLLSNGLAKGEYDKLNNIRFWPLNELARVKDCAPELARTTYHDQLVFADYSTWAHAYAISMSSGTVSIVGSAEPVLVTISMDEFLSIYVNNAQRLFPEVPV